MAKQTSRESEGSVSGADKLAEYEALMREMVNAKRAGHVCYFCCGCEASMCLHARPPAEYCPFWRADDLLPYPDEDKS